MYRKIIFQMKLVCSNVIKWFFFYKQIHETSVCMFTKIFKLFSSIVPVLKCNIYGLSNLNYFFRNFRKSETWYVIAVLNKSLSKVFEFFNLVFSKMFWLFKISSSPAKEDISWNPQVKVFFQAISTNKVQIGCRRNTYKLWSCLEKFLYFEDRN